MLLAATIIWAVGPWVAGRRVVGLIKRSGWPIEVLTDLTVLGQPNIFSIGDTMPIKVANSCFGWDRLPSEMGLATSLLTDVHNRLNNALTWLRISRETSAKRTLTAHEKSLD